MESAGDIDLGSAAKLRRDCKKAQSHSLKAIQMLANALSPVVSLDKFLPSSRPGVDDDLHALETRPCLIMTADEERKQTLSLNNVGGIVVVESIHQPIINEKPTWELNFLGSQACM